MLKKLVLSVVLTSLIVIFSHPLVAANTGSSYAHQSNPNTLFQVSPVAAFAESLWDGWVKMAELKAHGDFGLGTFDGVDGEMVLLDGTIYKIKGDGGVEIADNHKDLSPLAMITHFKGDYLEILERDYNYAELLDYVETKFPSSYWLYAIKITGTLYGVSARSGYKVPKPYPPLHDLFTYYVNNFSYPGPLQGTLLGLWTPDYFAGSPNNPLYAVNLPGFHFHFLSADKEKGGHLYETAVLAGATLEICFIHKLEMLISH